MVITSPFRDRKSK